MRLHVALTAFLATACSLSTEPGTPKHPELPENRGSHVGTQGLLIGGPMAWSANSEALYFATVEQVGSSATLAHRIRQAPLQAAATVLHEPSRSPSQLIPTADGSTLYFSVPEQAAGNDYVVHRLVLPGGGAETVATGIVGGHYGHFATPQSFDMLSDGSIVFVGTGQVLVHQRVDGTRRELGSCFAVKAVSPMGDQVVCGNGGFPFSYSIVSLSNGARTPIVGPAPEATELAREFRWSESGLRVLYSESLDTHTWTVGSSSTRRVLADSLTDLSSGISHATMSRDGQTLVFWRWQCIRSTGFFACDEQNLLVVMDLDDLSERVVAVVKNRSASYEYVDVPLISPDGAKVAYRLGANIYVVDMDQ